ncbi:unnamed protein product [Didymodactylos carnosus]|uniref:Uncharacterized protein n=2 Tax=Didymodactylos carnosus TaxID=1234261 RepID=A0A8S2EAC1_9BILA|nr:unnamed protein product [Didymodactylos carnosus]CAF3875755.1 unnamed protein product [Didymodactylos carnosus]
MYHQDPPPEALPAALPSSTAIKNRRWFSAVPLIALCCLGISGFLLVATIVLALIPVYLPKRAGGTVVFEANQKIREKRGYLDDPKTSSTQQEQEQTAAQVSYRSRD